eukprot:m.25091 g.25091  ORF g.25091 m.25091 type:complete len:127 (-) comp9799_c1_seq3:560-940(-)
MRICLDQVVQHATICYSNQGTIQQQRQTWCWFYLDPYPRVPHVLFIPRSPLLLDHLFQTITACVILAFWCGSFAFFFPSSSVVCASMAVVSWLSWFSPLGVVFCLGLFSVHHLLLLLCFLGVFPPC